MSEVLKSLNISSPSKCLILLNASSGVAIYKDIRRKLADTTRERLTAVALAKGVLFQGVEWQALSSTNRSNWSQLPPSGVMLSVGDGRGTRHSNDEKLMWKSCGKMGKTNNQ
jgi:hypothetical protein